MVVRGAPAIAIAAALSLAVEVSNLEDFNGSTDDAVYFLQMKLEYLVSRYCFEFDFLCYQDTNLLVVHDLSQAIA
jgi:hypothetical protein